MVANASVNVNANHSADGKVEFNITAFDLAGNSLTVNQTHAKLLNITIDKKIDSLKSDHIQQQLNTSLATLVIF